MGTIANRDSDHFPPVVSPNFPKKTEKSGERGWSFAMCKLRRLRHLRVANTCRIGNVLRIPTEKGRLEIGSVKWPGENTAFTLRRRDRRFERRSNNLKKGRISKIKNNFQAPYFDEKNKRHHYPAMQYVDCVMSYCEQTCRNEQIFPTRHGTNFIWILWFPGAVI